MFIPIPKYMLSYMLTMCILITITMFKLMFLSTSILLTFTPSSSLSIKLYESWVWIQPGCWPFYTNTTVVGTIYHFGWGSNLGVPFSGYGHPSGCGHFLCPTFYVHQSHKYLHPSSCPSSRCGSNPAKTILVVDPTRVETILDVEQAYKWSIFAIALL